MSRNWATVTEKFLAEKVETLDEFKSALSMGYSFFQGYFFSKPIIVPGKAIPGYKLNYMRMLQETNKRELDFRALERIIKQDMTLCYTLLKYINSAYFGFRDEVTSLLSAIVLLGEKEIRRWASLVLFTLMGVDKPPEVVLRSLIRAQMCELLAADLGLKGHESELFLMGMFSMLDVLIGRPLAEILEDMNLAKEVKGALLGQENGYRDLYDLVVSYESGDWDRCFESASRLNVRGGLGSLDRIGPVLSGGPPWLIPHPFTGQRAPIDLIRCPIVKPLVPPPAVVPVEPCRKSFSYLTD